MMSPSLLELAQEGDEDAFAELVAPYHRELHLHCYRLLGSVTDADDLLQETMLAAWRGLSGFRSRASLRSWLYRIATNRCLNAIRDAKRRPPPAPVPPFEPPQPSGQSDVTWLQPYPDAWLEDVAAGPQARLEALEAIGLGFVTALQRLPPRQTAAVLLCDVLGFSVTEVADMLGASPTAVKGLRQRARLSLHKQPLYEKVDDAARSPREEELVRRFADAYASDDVDGVIRLLTDDAWLAMPPAPHQYRGGQAIAAFLRASAKGRGNRCLALLPTRANGQPAFICYLRRSPDVALEPSGIVVLHPAGDAIVAVTRFIDPRLVGIFENPPPPLRGFGSGS